MRLCYLIKIAENHELPDMFRSWDMFFTYTETHVASDRQYTRFAAAELFIDHKDDANLSWTALPQNENHALCLTLFLPKLGHWCLFFFFFLSSLWPSKNRHLAPSPLTKTSRVPPSTGTLHCLHFHHGVSADAITPRSHWKQSFWPL